MNHTKRWQKKNKWRVQGSKIPSTIIPAEGPQAIAVLLFFAASLHAGAVSLLQYCGALLKNSDQMILQQIVRGVYFFPENRKGGFAKEDTFSAFFFQIPSDEQNERSPVGERF